MIIHSSIRQQAKALSDLSYCNPFIPKRIELERAVLGEAFIYTDSTWHKRQDRVGVPPNIDLTIAKADTIVKSIREALLARKSASRDELDMYMDIVHYLLYNSFLSDFHLLLSEADSDSAKPRCEAPFYTQFLDRMNHFLPPVIADRMEMVSAEHLFACFYQLRRAFHFIYDNILGGSTMSVALRASVWESIFTHDMRRYRRSLTTRMSDITTLITGPSGTGKELVAQAIGYARFIPFEASTHSFREDYLHSFYPLNLSALSPTLIESELFGHRKGAFTGALQDRKGWFSLCSPLGSVFLDEIGECDEAIQVKLLRVLQTRTFQPVGDVISHPFHGKVIAATNRDLKNAMAEGTFRKDLYYRLCADIIQTPSLQEQLQESSEHLHHLVLHLAHRVVGEDEAPYLAEDTENFIEHAIGTEYHWPGNIRELEQCVRNILVRKHYTPHSVAPGSFDICEAFKQGNLTADELMIHYVSMVYAKTGSYEETGRRLKLDGRTVKSKVKPDIVEQYT